MKEFIEKLKSKLEELKASGNPYDSYWDEAMYRATELVNSTSNKTIDGVIEIVNQLAEEYNGGWIPCNERLPEAGQTVLVQDFEDYYEVCNCETKQGVKGFSSGDWWASANNYIAWQPLPAPYKEGCE